MSLALIGAGPRALGALEALARTGLRTAVDLYDPHPWPGAGDNFSPDQSALCLLNVPMRAVDLPPSPVGFPDLADWLGARDPDAFPQRAELGAYLGARLAALIARGPLHITRRAQMVTDLMPGWQVCGRRYDHVALILGQPASRPDDQRARWSDHAARTGATLLDVYPDTRLLRHAQHWAGRAVAIRGLGLSTLDAVRLLTEGMGGRFDGDTYHPSGREPSRIVPFSLNGLPPFPKPATAALDAALDPTAPETAQFRAALSHALTLPPEAALRHVCAALAGPARRILGCDPGPWLAAERDAPGNQHRGDPVDLLAHALAMAQGRADPDAGHVIGALWRKWQTPLRQVFNPADTAPDTAAAIVAFDEGLKRFSYGPPPDTARRLLVLVRAGLVDLRATDDPDIALTDRGWRLHGGTVADVDVMIDAVLPGPDLGALCDPLVAGLVGRGLITAAAPGLGARVAADGTAIGRDGPAAGLAVLGRMALGSVIAPDSIHDCFGATTDRWARALQGTGDASARSC